MGNLSKQVNFYIIREIIKKVKGKVPMPVIYGYLFQCSEQTSTVDLNCNDLKKYEGRINTFLNIGQGDLQPCFDTLISYGISKEYFDDIDKFIYLPNSYLQNLKNYFLDPDNESTSDTIKYIDENIMQFENLDGSKIVDSIRSIVADVQGVNMESDPALYYLTNKLSDTRFSPISSQDIKKIYQNIVPYMNSQDPFPDKDTDIYKKAIAKIKITETSETIRKNLFLLVEIYDYFCILDDDPESSTYEVKIHKLYDFLGLDKNLIDYIYGNVPDGCIPCREIAEKLALYKIPISCYEVTFVKS